MQRSISCLNLAALHPGTQDFTVLRHLTRLQLFNDYRVVLNANAQQQSLADLATLPDLRDLNTNALGGISSLTHLTSLKLHATLYNPGFLQQLLPLTGLQQLRLSSSLMAVAAVPNLLLPNVTQLFLMDVQVSRTQKQ